MEQLKPVIQHLAKFHFWYLCGVLAITGGVGWYITTSTLAQETEDRKSTINQKFSQAKSVQSKPLHPNQFSHQGMDGLIAAEVDDVYRAWTFQYAKQQGILVWPNRFDANFHRKVENLKPIEMHVPFPIEREVLDANQRAQYRNFIRDELPKLADIIGAKWGKSESQSAPDESLVKWSEANQTNWEDSRFSWAKADPTTLDVLYAQEDYWILEAILQIIARANGDVRGRYQATVKEIEFIETGPDAIGLAGQIMAPNSTAQSSPGSSGSMGLEGMDEGSGLGGGDAAAAMAAAASGNTGGAPAKTSLDPAEYRYVDKDFKPVSAERLRNAYTSRSKDDAFLAVAKRVPVRMRVKMDQRRLHRLITECGNYVLPLEVRQVRINCGSGSTFQGRGSSGGGGMELAMGGGGTGGMFSVDDGNEGMGADAGNIGMAGGGGMGMNMGANPRAALSDISPWDVDVEIYGIIYLYNPVDREKIGKTLDSTESSEPADADPGQPVADAAG